MTVLMTRAARNRDGTDPDELGSAASPLRRDMPLVPAASIAGRALVTVIAIMTFLASLSAGSAFLIADASRGWQSSVAQEATIQVRPTVGRDLDAETSKAADIARRTPGVADVRTFTAAESQHLLEPWLGSGLDLSELPVPRMIVVRKVPGENFDAEALRKNLAPEVPAATFDDHSQWLSRLSIMTRTVVGVAVLVFGLVLTAMLLAVAFATRGAMAGNREIIDVLHFVGAEDSYIAREFQRHFLRLGLRGGIIGAGLAAATFFVLSAFARLSPATVSGDQMETMFGGFGLKPPGYFAIAAICVGIAFLTGAISRAIVFRHLRSLN
ncbi:MAG: ABC transporter permease [Beijerinckiaceae bacterium]